MDVEQNISVEFKYQHDFLSTEKKPVGELGGNILQSRNYATIATYLICTAKRCCC